MDRRTQQPTRSEPSRNPLNTSKSPAAKTDAPSAAAKPSPLNSLSFGAQPRQTAVRSAVVQTTAPRAEKRVPQRAEKKVVVRSTEPATIIDRFMRWLERTIAALIEKFMARLPAFKFLKLSSLAAKLKKNAESAAKEKVDAEEKEDKGKDSKSAQGKAQEGPTVAM